MNSIPVREVMTSVFDYSTVDQDATVKEAINKLRQSFFLDEQGNAHGHAALLVVNGKKELVGILTLRSLLEALVLVEEETEKLFNYYFWTYLIDKASISAATIQVKKIMRSRKLISANSDDDLMKAIKLMVKHKINQLPIINGAGRLVGVLRSKDVFAMMNQLI